ncbi:MAG: porin family protein [Acidobacteria bacterium]|nr:porin family protein [Acidobacteriota bacterium]
MSYRPFRNTGRALLAACAVSFGVASVNAQSTLPNAPNPSRVDIFAGYSYLGTHSEIKPSQEQFSSVNVGAIGSGAYYFNKYFGGEIAMIANPDAYGHGQNDAFYGYYAGPIFRLPLQNYTLFAHGLAGGVRGVGPNIPGGVGYNPYQWGVGLAAGGGMDYDLPFFNHHLGLRLFEADYRYTHIDFGPADPAVYLQGGRANISGAELSSGLLWHIGSIVPPPPIQYSCAVTTPTGTIYPGDPVTITGTATNVLPKKTPTYNWTGSDGVKVTGDSNVASVDTKDLAPGSYTVKGHVADGKKPGRMADCSTPFTVTQFQPPTISCSANPTTLNAGDPVTITATGNSPQNRPLTYSYSSTAGSISGNTSTATLATTGAAPGTTITVTCNVVDDKGQTASQQTTVTLNAPPPPPAPTTSSLCTITFDKDKARPTRVDNEAKACLDDIALAEQRDTTAKLAIVGNSEPVKVKGHKTSMKEKRAAEMTQKRAEERAVNEKAYLVNEKGLNASNIAVYTGTAGTNSDATTLIPSGATLDQTGLTPVDETQVKAVPREPVVHHHRHHAAKSSK